MSTCMRTHAQTHAHAHRLAHTLSCRCCAQCAAPCWSVGVWKLRQTVTSSSRRRRPAEDQRVDADLTPQELASSSELTSPLVRRSGPNADASLRRTQTVTMTTVAAEFEHMELQQQYSSLDTVNNRWDDDWDNENSSARLFERSRIKALAGRSHAHGAAPSERDVISCHCSQDGSGS